MRPIRCDVWPSPVSTLCDDVAGSLSDDVSDAADVSGVHEAGAGEPDGGRRQTVLLVLQVARQRQRQTLHPTLAARRASVSAPLAAWNRHSKTYRAAATGGSSSVNRGGAHTW